jgi:hypothetical protein
LQEKLAVEMSETDVNTESTLNDDRLDPRSTTAARSIKNSLISKLFHLHSTPKQHPDHVFHDITVQKLFKSQDIHQSPQTTCCADIEISELGKQNQINECGRLCK